MVLKSMREPEEKTQKTEVGRYIGKIQLTGINLAGNSKARTSYLAGLVLESSLELGCWNLDVATSPPRNPQFSWPSNQKMMRPGPAPSCIKPNHVAPTRCKTIPDNPREKISPACLLKTIKTLGNSRKQALINPENLSQKNRSLQPIPNYLLRSRSALH
jgi:hypothetical protein